MKPILIIPPDTIDADGIKALNDNGICTVVATDPAKVQFRDPHATEYFSEVAVRFTRLMLARDTFISGGNWRNIGWDEVCRLFSIEAKKDTPFSAAYVSPEEKIREAALIARRDEECKIAREEARAEAAQRKAEREAAKKSGAKK